MHRIQGLLPEPRNLLYFDSWVIVAGAKGFLLGGVDRSLLFAHEGTFWLNSVLGPVTHKHILALARLHPLGTEVREKQEYWKSQTQVRVPRPTDQPESQVFRPLSLVRPTDTLEQQLPGGLFLVSTGLFRVSTRTNKQMQQIWGSIW